MIGDTNGAMILVFNSYRHSTLNDLIDLASLASTSSTSPRVDVWLLSCQRYVCEHKVLFTLLDAHEQIRAKSFRTQHHSQNFIIARAMLRIVIAAYCACNPKQVEFKYGPYGKPALAMARLSGDFTFNMSHSSNAVVIGLTSGAEIGVDIEEISLGSIRSEAIAYSCLNAEESLLLAHIPDNERPRSLLRLWTHKEACLKAIGCGLSMPPQDLTVRFTDCKHSIIGLSSPRMPRPLFGYDIPYDEKYVSAVVGTNQFQELRLFRP